MKMKMIAQIVVVMILKVRMTELWRHLFLFHV